MSFYHNTVGTAHRIDDQWYLKRMNIFHAHQYTKGDPEIKVGYVAWGTPELFDKVRGKLNGIWWQSDNFVTNYLTEVTDFEYGAVDWHESRVLSLMLANDTGYGISGIAPECTYNFYLADDPNLPMDFWHWAVCLDQAVADGCRVVVFSMWVQSSDYRDKFEVALADAAAAGTLVIFAGADAHYDDSDSMAGFDEMLVVGGINETDAKAASSAYGPRYDIVAPFTDILAYSLHSILQNGEITQEASGPYSSRSGNSYGAPMCGATAALMLSVNPSLTYTELRQLLLDTTDEIFEPNFYTYYQSSVGCVNTAKAVLKALSLLAVNATTAFPYIGFGQSLSTSRVYGSSCTTSLTGIVYVELGGFSQEAIINVTFKADNTVLHSFTPTNNALETISFDSTAYSWTNLTIEVTTASGTFFETYEDIRNDNVQVMKYHGLTNATEIDLAWHMKNCDVFHAWQHTRGSTEINTAIIDIGVCYNLPEFSDRLSAKLGYTISSDKEGSNTNCGTFSQDEHGSGTACMMVADHWNGDVSGVNNVSKHYTVIDYDVAESTELGTDEHFDYFHYGLKTLYDRFNIRISSSQYGFIKEDWSIYDLTSANNSVTQTWNDGHAHFHLARNEGYRADGLPNPTEVIVDGVSCWPGRYSNWNGSSGTPSIGIIQNNVITVGGIDEDNRWYNPNNPENTQFQNGGSNWGNHIDICGPWVRMPTKNHTGGITIGGGTSWSTPFVAGIGSLVFSINPNLSCNELKTILMETCDAFGDSQTRDYFFPQAGGVVNAGKAVTKALTTREDNVGKVFPYCKFVNLWPSAQPNDIKTELNGSVQIDLNGYSTDTVTEVSLNFDGEELYRGSPAILSLEADSSGESKEFIVSAKTDQGEETFIRYTDVFASSLTVLGGNIIKNIYGVSNTEIKKIDGSAAGTIKKRVSGSWQ